MVTEKVRVFGDEGPPPDSVKCGFDGAKCIYTNEILITAGVVALVSLICLAYFLYKRR